MDIIEKINYLLQEKKLQKKDFVKQLQALQPNLKCTGSVPSEQTIYGYLNGKRELKVELIPYIAEVLGVSEQELFSFDLEYSCNYNYRHSKEIREIINLLQYAPNNAVEKIKEQLLKYKAIYESELKI